MDPRVDEDGWVVARPTISKKKLNQHRNKPVPVHNSFGVLAELADQESPELWKPTKAVERELDFKPNPQTMRPAEEGKSGKPGGIQRRWVLVLAGVGVVIGIGAVAGIRVMGARRLRH